MPVYRQNEENFFIPRLHRKATSRGLLPTIEFLMKSRRETFLTISRGMYLGYFCLHCYSFYSLPFSYVDEQLFYLKALAANAMTGIIMLYYKIAHSKGRFTKKFFTSLVYEDNGLQTLYFSLLFICDYYWFNITVKYYSVHVLTSLTITNVLFFSGSVIRLLNLLDFRGNCVHSFLNSIVGRNAVHILRLADFFDTILFPAIVITCGFNKWAVFSAVSYFIYLYLRYKNTKNCYVRSHLTAIKEDLILCGDILYDFYWDIRDLFRAIFNG